MRKVKRNPFLSGVVTILGGVLLVAGVASAQPVQTAQVSSDKAGAILVYPKLVFSSVGRRDTIIQLSNTSPHQIAARCFLVNANSHCSNAGALGVVPLVCDTNVDCNPQGITGGLCVAGWQETDFSFVLTGRQPIAWKLSDGLSVFPLDGLINVGPIDNDPTLPADIRGQRAFNRSSSIPAAPEDPFVGELKCIQVELGGDGPNREVPREGTDSDNNFAGDLKGEATIVLPGLTDLDARAYNAIAIQAIHDANDGDQNLVLGVEYAGCPSYLIVDHFFDDADIGDDAGENEKGDIAETTLTLIPCSENFNLQRRTSTVAQMLVYNEFEQRFSTSRRVTCFESVRLSDIDTRPGVAGDAASIFNVGVQGTLTGQTRIRGVDAGDPSHGDGLLAVAEEFHGNTESLRVRSAAFNIHQSGARSRTDVLGGSDVITIPTVP